MSNFQPIIKCSEQFRPLYNVPPNTKLILALGGRGGMKTYEVSKSAAYHCTLGGKRIQILRDEETRIKDSILSEILTHYDKANISSGNRLDKYFNRLENGIKLRSNGDSVLFTKGFRQSSLEKSAGMKGVANVDIAIIEEGEDVRDKFLFNSYHDSLRKANELGELVSYIIFIMNPPDVNHFIIRDYYDLVPVQAQDHPECLAKDVEGYFKLIPKQLDGVIYIFTTYKDNKYLPTLTKEKYELYGIHSIDGKPNPFYDPHYYLNQIMGYCTTGRKGQYFKRYQMISNEEYNALPYTEVYGLDFGTTSPAGLIAVKAHRNNIYVKELNYEPLPVKQLGFEMDRLGLKGDSLIVADCAEPETIKTLRYGQAHTMSADEIQRYPVCAMGFGNIRESPDKRIEAGISRLLGMNIHVVSGSDNLINEFANYCEAVDRNGIGTGKPVDAYNHCFVGSTLIECESGVKPIVDVEIGDMVYTRNGLRQVVNKFNNGCKKVRSYRLIFDTWETKVICTEDHKVWTESGWVEISRLQEGATLCIGKSSEVNDTICTTVKNTTLKDVVGFMWSYGSRIMGSGLKAITSITRTVIGTTMRFGTWNVSKVVSTYPNICSQETKNRCVKQWITPEPLQMFGTEAKKERNGTQYLQKSNGKNENQENIIAKFAGKNIPLNTEASQSFAMQTAKLKHLEIGEEMEEQVYDLMIDTDHEYFANGLLVHNCIDPLRYVSAVIGKWF